VTAVQKIVWALECDDCGRRLRSVDARGLRSLVTASASRIRGVASEEDWTRLDGDEDLCPTCTCASVGHDRRSNGVVTYCGRCSETLLAEQVAVRTAAVKGGLL